MATRERITRNAASREALSPRMDNLDGPGFTPASPLAAPKPPDGIEFRWVRTVNASGKNDASNLASRYSQGWTPVLMTQLGENVRMRYPSIHHRDSEVIGVDSMILMQRTKEQGKLYRDYINNRTKQMIGSVQQNLKSQSAHAGHGYEAPTASVKATARTGEQTIEMGVAPDV